MIILSHADFDCSEVKSAAETVGLSMTFQSLANPEYNSDENQLVVIYPLQDKVDLLSVIEKLAKVFPNAEITIFTPKSNQRSIGKLAFVVPVVEWDHLTVSIVIASWLIWKASISIASLGSLKGASSPIRKVFEEIEIIGPMDEPALITGPPGTGKELIARELHNRGRPGKPFLAVNCAGLNRELAGSELFGHMPGSFTGAKGKKEGFFKDARDGTLFLDEFGELSLDLQAQLLRALQERTVRKVGSSQEESYAARVLLGTNKDLEEGIKDKTFRQDLFDRITFITHVPSLVERREDILLLGDFFLAEYNQKYGKNLTIPNDLMETLVNYDWPGNVRELKQVMTKAAAFTKAKEGPLDSTRLTEHMQRRRMHGASNGNQLNVSWKLPWKVFHDNVLRQYMQTVLKLTGGDKKKAMAITEMSRATFYEKLKLLE